MYINIPTSRHRCGQKHTRCVDRLEDTKQVTLSSNLLDQHGSKPFVSQLLDNAKEIYFARVHLPRSKKWSLKAGDSASNNEIHALSTNEEFDRNPGDKSYQSLGRRNPHTDMPFWMETWRRQCPVKSVDQQTSRREFQDLHHCKNSAEYWKRNDASSSST